MSDPSIIIAASTSKVFADLLPQVAVFPLRPIVRIPRDACTCRKEDACKSIGKHPAVFWGSLKPAEKIGGPPGVGYGIATGRRSGLFVVDLDGAAAILAFYSMGPVPRTFAVRRGADRAHVYFLQPSFNVKNSTSELGPKIDVRGDGGFVVAPGSPHKSGMIYEIADDMPIAQAPEWLLKWRGLRQPQKRIYESSTADVCDIETRLAARVPKAWRVARAKAWLSKRPPAISEQNGHKVAMATMAVAVREMVLTSESMILEAIEDWNERCRPPWEGSELMHKIDEALHRSTVPWNLGITLAYDWETRRKS